MLTHAGIELTAWVAIGTDYIGRCKSTNMTIITVHYIYTIYRQDTTNIYFGSVVSINDALFGQNTIWVTGIKLIYMSSTSIIVEATNYIFT